MKFTVEMPFEYEGVRIEQDNGGIWVTIDEFEFEPHWIGPRTLKALEEATK